MKTKLLRERGQALVLIAFAAIALFAIAGLAIDGSHKYSDRRHAQNAADTAALAAALKKTDLLTGPPALPDENCSTADPLPWSAYCSTLLQAAYDQATANGYDGMLNNDVDIYSPPISGPYKDVLAKNMYVQVIIKSTVDTYFMRVLGIKQSDNIVQATALAGKGGKIANGNSVVSMDPNPGCGNGSFNVGGNGNIELTGGGMFVNSSASCGYSQTSCSVTLTMNGGTGITSAGSPIDQSCGTPAPADTTQTQILIPDEIVYPDRPVECNSAAPSPDPLGGSKYRLYPGKYTSFPPSGIGNNKELDLQSGVYCIDSSIQWTGSDFSKLDGTSGVTFYLTNGHDFDINIGSIIQMDAPSSGDYQGYLFIVEGTQNTHPTCTINGGTNIDLNGTIFAPYCNITINGDNSTTSEFNAQIIGWDVKLNGGSTLIITYDPDDNAKVKRRVGLMK